MRSPPSGSDLYRVKWVDFMRKYFVASLGLFALVACQGEDPVRDVERAVLPVGTAEADIAANPDAVGEPVATEISEEGYPSGDSLNGLQEILPSDIQPTFERDTVIRLNAIVQQSLDTIDAYDVLRRDVKANPAKEADPETQAALTELDASAKAALADLTAEVERLEASEEVYNEVVLAGMITFVTKVEAEIETVVKDGFSF